jgi:hypothetical protein
LDEKKTARYNLELLIIYKNKVLGKEEELGCGKIVVKAAFRKAKKNPVRKD